MALYPSALFGARSVEMSWARGLWRKRTAEGRRMMESSAKRLYRNGWTSSKVSGPPRLRRRTPTLRPWSSGSQGRCCCGGEEEEREEDDDGDDDEEEVEGCGVKANEVEASRDEISSLSFSIPSSDVEEGEATAEGGRGPLCCCSGSEEEEEGGEGEGEEADAAADDGEVEAAAATTDDQSSRQRR